MSGQLREETGRSSSSNRGDSSQNGAQSNVGGSSLSPLKRFGRAKSKINGIYDDLVTYANDVAKFLSAYEDTEDLKVSLKSTS